MSEFRFLTEEKSYYNDIKLDKIRILTVILDR